MTLVTFATWIVVALMTALGAGAVVKDGGHGLKADVLLGLAGSGTASVIMSSIAMLAEPGIATTALVACAGAVAVIAVQRRFFNAPPPKPPGQTGRR